jgi:hypothetical protein
MKNKITLTAIAFFIMVATFAQRKTTLEENKNNNCSLPAILKVSRATNILLDNYKKLLNPTANNLCTSSNGTVTSSSKMPLPYYGGSGAAGNISFSSFIEAGSLLRTVFGSIQSQYDYYGVCAPNPIVWDASATAVNHVFAAKFVTIPNFVAAGVNAEFTKTIGVPIADIATFDCAKIEEANGYAAATENVNYNNIYSSKGILVLVTFKTGVKQYCYFINNYDISSTLKWKE